MWRIRWCSQHVVAIGSSEARRSHRRGQPQAAMATCRTALATTSLRPPHGASHASYQLAGLGRCCPLIARDAGVVRGFRCLPEDGVQLPLRLAVQFLDGGDVVSHLLLLCRRPPIAAFLRPGGTRRHRVEHPLRAATPVEERPRLLSRGRCVNSEARRPMGAPSQPGPRTCGAKPENAEQKQGRQRPSPGLPALQAPLTSIDRGAIGGSREAADNRPEIRVKTMKSLGLHAHV